MLFNWQGINAKGLKVQGKDHAANVKILLAQLQHREICVLSIKKIYGVANPALKASSRKIMEFTRQMALLNEANFELIQSLQLLIQQEKNLRFKKIINALKLAIENGASLAEAFSHFPHHFDKMYCGIIQSGEQSGTLGAMLMHLAQYQENLLESKVKITKALFYPITLIFTTTLITLGLLLYVIPQFQTIFSSFGAPLPAFTLLIIHISQTLQNQMIVFLITSVLFFSIYLFFLKNTSAYQHWRDRIKLALPFCKQLIIANTFARWTRIMSTLLTAQLPLIESLQIANQTLVNLTLQSEMEKSIELIKEGQAFYQALATHKYFPKQLISILSVGENTGRLPQVLQKMAQTQQSMLDRQIDYFSKWLEPVSMLLLAIMVGSLIIGMYLPIFQLGAIL